MARRRVYPRAREHVRRAPPTRAAIPSPGAGVRSRAAADASRNRHEAPSRHHSLRALLAGVVLLGAVGSCELPKPNIPSIGSTPAGPSAVARV